MNIQEATEEYRSALKLAQKEYKELLAAGKEPHPAVLDEILPNGFDMVQDIGIVEIPTSRITGIKSAGRVSAFTATFRPLLSMDTEFFVKWVNLCAAHLGETGITEPIVCFEYLGNFYIQEGNKRVSVLRHFEAPRIPGSVTRIIPPMSDDPRIKAYYEFLDFYKSAKLYAVQFRRPGDYTRLLNHLGKKTDEAWTEDERRTFNAYYHYFLDAFETVRAGKSVDVLPEEALLFWLEIHPYQELGRMSTSELKKSLASLWEDILTTTKPQSVQMKTKTEEAPKQNIISRLVSSLDTLHVAFVHQLDTSRSTWVLGHEEGREHLERVMGDQVKVRSYFDANTSEQANALIDQAVADGAEVVITTAPLLSRATLKGAVKYPKVRFLNCSVDQPYSSLRTYYGRMYEGKFISGAIAGAMAQNDRIGYIASYPILGTPASINAFALGAQMTNPRAQVELRWSCCEGTPQADFFADGIRVVSNRNAPTQAKMYLDFCSYGTYLMDSMGELVPLASPIWGWGKFYEFVARNILSGGWKIDKGQATALNYWLGMDSGVIGIILSDKLPEGTRQMAKLLRKAMTDGNIDPFRRKIVSQDGTVKNDGSSTFTPDQILHMDWLCSNVIGQIPPFEEILPASQRMVRELGVYRDSIPAESEGKIREDFDRVR